MPRSKIETFIGFSIRSRSLVAGTNAIAFCKRVEVIFLCHTASENARKEAMKLARRYGALLVLSKVTLLDDLVFKNNIKMFAITDKKLAKAVMENIDETYEIIFRGEDINE
ncbi:MAG: hypothetical protein RR458_04130 [Clostridia bacterium]